MKEVKIHCIQPEEVAAHIQGEDKLTLAYFVESGVIGLGIGCAKGVSYVAYEMMNMAHVELAKALFEGQEILKIIHDTKVLRHALSTYGISLKGEIFDTFIAAYLLHPTNDTYDIAELSEIFLDQANINNIEDILGKGKSMKSWLQLEEADRMRFITERAHMLMPIYEEMNAQLIEYKMEELFYQIEMPLVEVLFDMEKEGIRIDPEQLKAYGEELDTLIEETAKEVYEYAGEVFNINSPKQLCAILFEKMDIPPVKRTTTGYSTAAEVL